MNREMGAEQRAAMEWQRKIDAQRAGRKDAPKDLSTSRYREISPTQIPDIDEISPEAREALLADGYKTIRTEGKVESGLDLDLSSFEPKPLGPNARKLAERFDKIDETPVTKLYDRNAALSGGDFGTNAHNPKPMDQFKPKGESSPGEDVSSGLELDDTPKGIVEIMKAEDAKRRAEAEKRIAARRLAIQAANKGKKLA